MAGQDDGAHAPEHGIGGGGFFAEGAADEVAAVDTTLGTIVHVQKQFFSHVTDTTTGSVEAPGMPVAYPWLPYTGDPGDLVTHRIPGVRVNGTTSGGTSHTFTDGDGEFALQHGTIPESIMLESSIGLQGEWYWLSEASALYISDSVNTTVGSNEDLSLVSSSINVESRTAQADVVVSSHRAREFFKGYISATASGLTYPVYLFPNNQQQVVCNAYADWGDGYWLMVFGASNPLFTKPCYNFGTHSVVGHEYGHIALLMIDDALTEFRSFHEGYADTYGNLLNDDSVQGREHWMDGDNVRDDPTTSGINCQFPIPSNTTASCYCDEEAPHFAGQLLSGPWVRIRNTFKAYYGSSTGLEMARETFGLWSLVTLGGDEACESAHPGTLVEVLSVMDDAYAQELVCDAFGEHGITCANCCP